jgi:hypothetical protein
LDSEPEQQGKRKEGRKERKKERMKEKKEGIHSKGRNQVIITC